MPLLLNVLYLILLLACSPILLLRAFEPASIARDGAEKVLGGHRAGSAAVLVSGSTRSAWARCCCFDRSSRSWHVDDRAGKW